MPQLWTFAPGNLYSYFRLARAENHAQDAHILCTHRSDKVFSRDYQTPTRCCTIRSDNIELESLLTDANIDASCNRTHYGFNLPGFRR